MTEAAESRGETEIAATRAALYAFLVPVAALLVAGGTSGERWPLRALGPAAEGASYGFGWGLAAAVAIGCALVTHAAASGLPRRGPLVAFTAVAAWLALQAGGCAWRGVAGGNWVLAVVAVLVALHAGFVVVRLRWESLIERGDVILAGIGAFALLAATRWAGRWAFAG